MTPAPLHVLIREAPLPATSSVAILHGHGDDPADLLARVGGCAPDDVTLIAPVGPVLAANGGPAWFISMEGDAPGDPTAAGTLIEAIRRLDVTLDVHAGATGRPPQSLFGYSQGAATALALVFGDLPEPRWRPTMLVTVAGWLVSDPDLGWDCSGAAPHTRALLLHGADDEVVDAQLGRGAARVLTRSGVDSTFVEIPADHALRDEEIARIWTIEPGDSSR